MRNIIIKVLFLYLCIIIDIIKAEYMIDEDDNYMVDANGNKLETGICYRVETIDDCGDNNGRQNYGWSKPVPSFEKTKYIYGEVLGSCAATKFYGYKNKYSGYTIDVNFILPGEIPEWSSFSYWGLVKSDDTIQDYNEPYHEFSFKKNPNIKNGYYLKSNGKKFYKKCSTNLIVWGNGYTDGIRIHRINDIHCKEPRPIPVDWCQKFGNGDVYDSIKILLPLQTNLTTEQAILKWGSEKTYLQKKILLNNYRIEL
jgi:hypothetical protein